MPNGQETVILKAREVYKKDVGRKGVMVLVATNRIDIIDPALLRSGRFYLLMELNPPDEKARREIFKTHTRGELLGSGIDFERLRGDGWDVRHGYRVYLPDGFHVGNSGAYQPESRV